MISVAVILTTCNRPDALSAVLEGYLAQGDRNFELIIADDGSTDEMREVISSYQRHAPFNISHVRHEVRGFRAAAIRNRALEKTSADYMIFSNGNCIPFPGFVSGHRSLAEKGWFLVSSRILLREVLTSRILTKQLAVYAFSRRQWLHTRLQGDINSLLSFFNPLRSLSRIDGKEL